MTVAVSYLHRAFSQAGLAGIRGARRAGIATISGHQRLASRWGIVYRAFFEPTVTTYAEGGSYPERACVGCSFGANQVANPAHLNARDTTLAYASRAPQVGSGG